jgi:hypothetical protein
MDIISLAIVAAAGIVVGALIMRNNYSRFSKNEADIKKWIEDADITPDQVVKAVRKILGV